MVVDYLRAAACGATSSKTVTFYLGGAGRPGFNTWSSTTSEGPGHRLAHHEFETTLEALSPQLNADTNTDWGWFAGRSRMDGATITWPNPLIQRIRQPGRLDAATVDLLAIELGSRLSAPIADRA